jgi:N-acetylneuraminic acid mutarotase
MKMRLAFRTAGLILVFALLLFCLGEVKPASAVSSNVWESKAPMHTPRSSLGVAVVDGQIYAIGGLVDPPSWVKCTGVNEMYNPVNDKWVYKASMPTPRASFATAVYDGKIYCIGGTLGVQNSTLLASDANEVYNPSTNKWTAKTSMPTPRVGVTACVVDGKIYLLGGNSSLNEVYDPKTDSWSTKTPMPAKPSIRQIWSCTSAVADGKIHVFGAFPLAYSHQVYDPKTDSWSTGTPIVLGYYLATCGATENPQNIYVFGVDSTWWDLGPPKFTSLLYNPATDGWRVTAGMPTPRVNSAVAAVGSVLYVIGGSVVMIENNAHPTSINEQYLLQNDKPADNQAPKVTVQSPENKTYSDSVQLTYDVNEPTVSVRLCIDGQNLIFAALNQTLNLPIGTHNITMYAIDSSGNIGASDTVSFSVVEPQAFPTLLMVVAASVLAVCIVALTVFFRKSKKK